MQREHRLAFLVHRKQQRDDREEHDGRGEGAMDEALARSLALAALLARQEVELRVLAHRDALHARAERAHLRDLRVDELAARGRDLHVDLGRGRIARDHAIVEVHVLGAERGEPVHLESQHLR